MLPCFCCTYKSTDYLLSFHPCYGNAHGQERESLSLSKLYFYMLLCSVLRLFHDRVFVIFCIIIVNLIAVFSANFPVSGVVFLVAYTRLCKSLCRFVGQSVSPSAHQPVSPSVHQSVSPSTHQSVSPSVRQSISPSVRQSVSPSVHQSISPSVHPSISPSVHPSVTLLRYSPKSC